VDQQPATIDADIQRVRFLEIPVVWFAFQLVEYVIAVGLIWALVPHTWPQPVYWGLWIGTVVALSALNHAVRRRFIPR
jgi:hypothetical protein